MTTDMSDELAWLYRTAAEAGATVLAAWTKAIEDRECSYSDIAWATLAPMGKLNQALAAIEAHVAHQRFVRAFAAMGQSVEGDE